MHKQFFSCLPQVLRFFFVVSSFHLLMIYFRNVLLCLDLVKISDSYCKATQLSFLELTQSVKAWNCSKWSQYLWTKILWALLSLYFLVTEFWDDKNQFGSELRVKEGKSWVILKYLIYFKFEILKLFQLFSRMIGPEVLQEDNVKLTNGCSIKKNPLSKGQRKLKKRHEKSVIILILIVSVFLACHSFRLGLQIYQIVHTDQFTKEHYDFCHQLGSLPYPTSFLIFVDFNNLFLVFNSSINFVIYCAVRKSFRERIWSILSRPFKNLVRKASLTTKKSPTTTNHTIWKK